jgi:hypothetical protein
VARIDFGNGRVLERTVGGNSIHYILDSAGRPVDALPGLYHPAAFLAALTRVEPLARELGSLPAAQAQIRVAEFHRQGASELERVVAGVGSVPGLSRGSSLREAEPVAVTKAAMEMPVAARLDLGRPLTLAQLRGLEAANVAWSRLGERLYADVPGARLDAKSRALLRALEPSDWTQPGSKLNEAGMNELLIRFDASLRKDTAHNELQLHARLHEWLAARPALSLQALNERVYRELFLTPAEDAWLGMATPLLFSGLMRDGVTQAAQ